MTSPGSRAPPPGSDATGTGAPRVKICGNASRRDVAIAIGAGADAVGFVTEVPVETHRNVDRDEAGVLVADVPPFVTSVLVIMPDDVDHAVDLVAATGPDAVQVHAGLDGDDVAALRRRTETPTIRKIDLGDGKGEDGDTAPPDAAALADDPSDAYLVDASGERGRGGTGETADWDAARRFVRRVDAPVVLAGGLTPENVAEAVETVRPFAVDVSSGVERSGSDGEGKDPRLVQRFVDAATARDGGDGAGGPR